MKINALPPRAALPAVCDPEIFEDNPLSWRHFACVELSKVRALATICADLMRRDHVERVIAMVLHFAGHRHGASYDVGRVPLDVCQNEVAGAANVGRTVAGAVLRDGSGDVGQARRRH